MAERVERNATVNFTAAGNGAAWKLNYQNSFGGLALFVYGTWGGSTATLQISPDGTNWAAVGGAGITANGVINVTAPARYARCVMTGGTPTVSAQLLA
jgi:hypothetical protein